METGTPDPANPTTRTGGNLPKNMTFSGTGKAGHGTINFIGSGNGNGTISIAMVDNAIMNESFTLTGTTNPITGNLVFSITGSSGVTGSVELTTTSANLTAVRGSTPKTVMTITITEGTNAFASGDRFTFSTAYQYDTYRDCLAAPDGIHDTSGRSSVTSPINYNTTIE